LWRNVIVAHWPDFLVCLCVQVDHASERPASPARVATPRPRRPCPQALAQRNSKVGSGLLFGKHPAFSRPLDQRKLETQPCTAVDATVEDTTMGERTVWAGAQMWERGGHEQI
jgi:hypothetical protein